MRIGADIGILEVRVEPVLVFLAVSTFHAMSFLGKVYAMGSMQFGPSGELAFLASSGTGQESSSGAESG